MIRALCVLTILALCLCVPLGAEPEPVATDQPAEPASDETPVAPADPAASLFAEIEAAVVEALAAGDNSRALLIADGAHSRGLPPARVHLLKARIFAAKQDLANEEQQLRGALHSDPGLTEASLRLAAILESRGLWLEAADLYRQTIDNAPANPAAYLKLARLLIQRERVQNAIDVLQAAREAAPDDVSVLMACAAAREHVGQYEQARLDYQQAARMDTGKTRRTALMKVADISMTLDDYGVAVGYYRAAVAEGAALNAESYARVSRSTDQAMWKLFDDQWQLFVAYLDRADAALEREELYLRLSPALAECTEINTFMGSLDLPDSLAAVHTQRRLLYSLICETLVNAVSYLNTGDAALAADARDRRLDVEREKKTVDAQAAKI